MSRASRRRKDVFPQILTVSTNTPAGASDYAVQEFALPVSRIGGSVNKATVVELVWIHYYPAITDYADTSAQYAMYVSTGTLHQTSDAATAITIAEDFASARTIAPIFFSRVLTTSGNQEIKYPLKVDLTDDAGNGILVGVDTMALVYANVAGTTASYGTVKMAYRLVEVGLPEYVGMVQSQAQVVL